jgi:Uma2 family endonuclease
MSTTRKTRLRIPRLSLGSAGIRMTPEEFDAARDSDERFRYELIEGILVVSRLPSVAEGDPNEELGYLLRSWRDNHPDGSALDATLQERYVYLENSRRRADRLIWCGLGGEPDLEKDIPTIAVEFVSKGKRDWLRDYVEKRTEYLAIGIKEYWVIDRFGKTLSVSRPGDPGPAEQQLGEADTYRTPLLPGFELPLAKLLAMADRWKRPR